MDYFYGDSANVTNGFSLNKPVGSTLEDKLTRKRWTRGLLAFYACLLLAGATAIGASQNGIRFNHGLVPRPTAPILRPLPPGQFVGQPAQFCSELILYSPIGRVVRILHLYPMLRWPAAIGAVAAL
jgi:hypothetical protein